MSRQSTPSTIATIGIDIGKNTFHLVGLDQRGNIVLQLKTSRAQLERRLANVPHCLVGMEACSGTHHIGRQLEALGHDVRLIPAQYVKPFLKGHKNDYRDAEAIAEAVQRPTMHFVSIKTPDQMDLLALHRVRSRLVSQRTGAINQIRGFLIERGITVRQAQHRCARHCLRSSAATRQHCRHGWFTSLPIWPKTGVDWTIASRPCRPRLRRWRSRTVPANV